MLGPQGDANLLEHVHGHGVRPGPTRTPLPLILTMSAMPTALFMLDCGLWTTAVPVSWSRSFSVVDVHTVGRQWSSDRGCRTCEAAPPRVAEVLLVVVLVGLGLGRVHVKARAQVVPGLGGGGHGLVSDGEGGVQAEEGLELRVVLRGTAFDERHVFVDSGLRRLGSVAVRQLIAERARRPVSLTAWAIRSSDPRAPWGWHDGRSGWWCPA